MVAAFRADVARGGAAKNVQAFVVRWRATAREVADFELCEGCSSLTRQSIRHTGKPSANRSRK
jgi:hypothetical protein